MSNLDKLHELAMIRGSLNALQVVSEIVSEMQEQHDEAPFTERYDLMLSNWIRLQLELLNESQDLMRRVQELKSLDGAE